MSRAATAGSYRTLRWLTIPVIAAHNLEEWLTLRSVQAPPLAERLGLHFATPSWPVMQLGLILVTLAPAGIVAWAALGEQRWWKDAAVCGLGGVFLANVFVPHIPAAILAGGYSPGVLTAALVNLPFFPILFRQGVLEGRLTARQAFSAALIGALSLPLCIAGALALSRILLGVVGE